MKLRITLAVVALLVVLGVLAGIKAVQIKAMIDAGKAGGGPPPETVDAAAARHETWESFRRSVGSVSAVEGITVRSEVPGVVKKIRFTPGKPVAAGAVLVELDSSIEAADLQQARADADLARRQLARANDLSASGTISAADLDQATSRNAAVEARMASLEATLAKKTIKAPFGGYLGIQQISVGQYLQPGDEIVSLQALDRVRVEFSLPQRDLAQIDPGLVVRAVYDADPPATFEGAVTAINPQVDADTRTVRVQATFDNPGQRLRAGMFVTVEMVLRGSREVIVIPGTAVLYAPYGNTVFVVKGGDDPASGLTVEQKIVRLGQTKGDYVEVTEGLTGTERVVTAGVFKLRNGQKIAVSDQGTRPPSETPNPADS